MDCSNFSTSTEENTSTDTEPTSGKWLLEARDLPQEKLVSEIEAMSQKIVSGERGELPVDEWLPLVDKRNAFIYELHLRAKSCKTPEELRAFQSTYDINKILPHIPTPSSKKPTLPVRTLPCNVSTHRHTRSRAYRSHAFEYYLHVHS